jgi:hypothetical protein
MNMNRISLIGIINLLCYLACHNALAFDHYIDRKGHQLFDGKQVFRFAGIHAPELHRIEDDSRGICEADVRGWGKYFKWPTADEQENWIKSLTRSGHKAMRIYVLSVEDPNDQACEREAHILRPESSDNLPRINESAFIHYDRMIALANKYKLRLILPFIDHWEWWGGRKQLAAFYGEHEDKFYDTSSKTYQAYLHIIEQVVTRTNTITGVPYNRDKAIMAWETGNELKLTTDSFIVTTAAHIKALAPKQLVVDGNYLSINKASLNDPNVDIISNHYYTVNGNNHASSVFNDLKGIDAKKPYLLGEFGLANLAEIEAVMHAAVHTDYNGAKAAGALVWGLRGRRHNGGFYWHADSDYFSYHLPGFPDGDHNDEQAVVDLVRTAQAQMSGLGKAPPLPIPEAPILREILGPDNIRWMGAPLGRFYRIESSRLVSGPWKVIGDNVSDGMNKFDPASDKLFSDPDSYNIGETRYYRIIAMNESGESAASNVNSYTKTRGK